MDLDNAIKAAFDEYKAAVDAKLNEQATAIAALQTQITDLSGKVLSDEDVATLTQTLTDIHLATAAIKGPVVEPTE